MKRRVRTFVSILLAVFYFAGCSNLFEDFINEDMTFKKGDDSLLAPSESLGDIKNISSGLVVIKNSEKSTNQISYTPNQKIYYVGKVPSAFDDYAVNYKNGTKVSLLGKDDPVELKCYSNDSNAKVVWDLSQTWKYVPQEDVRTTKDADGNEVTYRGIKSQTAEKLENAVAVNHKIEKKGRASVLVADLPYGVTVATCTVIADDTAYQTEYKIILTKEYITTIADSNPSADANNITDHGLVVIKASDPGRNAINYSSTVYEYEVGDSTGANPALDLTGRDDPVVFKCFVLDDKAELTWKAVQTKEYQPVWDSDKHGIASQNLQVLETPVVFDFIKAEAVHEGTTPFMQFLSEKKNELKSNLPYGVTEVYATITAYNTDASGALVPNVTQYKITLTKRYIITTASNDSSKENEAGLAVYANGKTGSLISYKPAVLNYSVENLSGANDPVKIEFRPEEPAFTDLSWTAIQTHSYEPKIYSVSNGSVTYTYQSGGEFAVLNNPVNLLEASGAGNSAPLSVSKEGILSYCQGNLPYGITVVTVNVISQDDKDSATTYKITLKKKQVSTNINIVSSNGDELSTVTDRGLVVLGAQNESLNKISFNPSKFEYSVGNVQAADNDMKFRCYLADTDAKISWQMVQTKLFAPVKAVYEKEEKDSLLGTTEKIRYEYISGQTETDCNVPLQFSATDNISANEIKASIPYGITEVTAVISSENESTTMYKITLRRDICAEPVSEEEFKKSLEEGSGEGNYSQLKELNLTIADEKGDSTSVAKLEPEFSPSHTTYTLTVDEEADGILIDAIAADMNAEISEPSVVTKYGEVPALSGMNINLVGGTTRITFKVKDETGISRTYTIYVEKPEDGDTTLSALNYTPGSGFENGVSGFTFDDSFKGGAANGSAKYTMTLSADSRKDVRQVVFTAVPNNKRTVVSYGISDSETSMPTSWTQDFKKDSVQTCTVDIGDDSKEEIKKVLWIKTVSDEYYHLTADKKSYEEIRRADTTYHRVLMKKAGDNSRELTALVAYVVNEDGTRTALPGLTFTSNEAVAYKAEDKIVNVSTYADKIEFYFRPLDKDAVVTYSAENTKWDKDSANTEFTGYSAAGQLQKKSGNCQYLSDGSSEYYELTIGSIEDGFDTKEDLPRGTTVVKILGRTYTFVKPDYTNVSYSIGFGKGDRKWNNYIYLTNDQTDLEMNITTNQQNQIVSISSCEHTADSTGNLVSVEDPEKKTAWSDFKKVDLPTKWTASIRNIPTGTTKLTVHVKNEKAEKDYYYYIIRADNTDTRLKNLTFGETVIKKFSEDWAFGMNTETTYTYEIEEEFGVDAGLKVLEVEPVNPEAIIKIERQHNAKTKVNSIEASGWSSAETVVEESKTIRSYENNFTEANADENAGSILYKITVTSSQTEIAAHTYYLIIHVKADTTAQLNALSIIQKGENGETSKDNRTILSNSFDPENHKYDNLFASLNYTGDIIIKPTVYPKAKITAATLTCDNDSLGDFVDNENNIITIPYDDYKNRHSKVYNITYTVQAQDASKEPVTYTVKLKIPEYKKITETETKEIITEKSFVLPANVTHGLAYRFGSVISDNTLAKDFFGGIDIIGTSDGSTWYESSFGGSGFQFVLNIDGKDYWVKLDAEGKLEALYAYDGKNEPEEINFENDFAELKDIMLTVTPKFVSDNEENYLELNLTLKKGDLRNVKLGAAIDTLIGEIHEANVAANDSVRVEETNNGFTMKSKDYSFSVILKNAYNVTDVTGLWYGYYDSGKYLTQVFDTAKKSGLKSDEDSAASFYWELDDAESEVTKTIRISMDKVN